jgi:hypothetical protein
MFACITGSVKTRSGLYDEFLHPLCRYSAYVMMIAHFIYVSMRVIMVAPGLAWPLPKQAFRPIGARLRRREKKKKLVIYAT